jgi:hypothetical protein
MFLKVEEDYLVLHRSYGSHAMKTLSVLIAAMSLGAGTSAASAGESAPLIETITVTAKRPHPGVVAERVPPEAVIEIAQPLPTDMPEMEVDSHIAPLAGFTAPESESIDS